MMPDLQHSIKVVARMTGLTPHVIRVWERRYNAVQPCRSGTNRRLYSNDEVERLKLLHLVTQAGHSIGTVARLPCGQLAQLAGESRDVAAAESGDHEDLARVIVSEATCAVRGLSTCGLEAALSRGIVSLGQHGLLQRVVGPLATRVGELWREGAITAAHEHFASSVIRNFLGRNSKSFALGAASPCVVVATPCGQLHELGAIMVGAAANDLGWRVVYLGPSLPAAEIAGAALQNRARAVALSIVYPEDDPNLPGELESLRRYLSPDIRILAGGRAAAAYAAVLERISALRAGSISDLYNHLDSLRSARQAA